MATQSELSKPPTMWYTPLRFGPFFSMAITAFGRCWSKSRRASLRAWSSSMGSGRMTACTLAGCGARGARSMSTSVSTFTPAPRQLAAVIGIMLSSVRMMGRAPRPSASARASAAAPIGPSVSPAG